jgi:hypothetical protein
VFERVGQAGWTDLGAATRPEGGDGRWRLSWKPADRGIHPGDVIEYAVRLDDGGPLLELIQFDKKITYDTWWARAWRDNKSAAIGAFSSAAVLLAYAGAFALVLLLAPARLARVGGAAALEELPRPSGNLAFLWDLARRVLENLTLPWLCRRPRVRRAWIKLYSDGKGRFEELGKAARSSYLCEPDVLDAWVARQAPRVELALHNLELFAQRQVYVELPVRVGEGGEIIERPNAEALRPIFAKDRTVVAIVGAGGTGKSTLACALARWALAEDAHERLAPHRMIPVFVVQDTTNLVEAVTNNLRCMLGDEELPDDLVRGLLAKQRLLVIVDALSEREPDTQKHVEQIFAQQVPINAIVITSRIRPNLGAVNRTTLYPVRLDAARVVPFLIGYLDRMEGVEQLKDGRTQLRLGERILALAESGRQKTTVTPLLVTLFADSARRRAAEGRPLDDMPDAIPDVFVDYLRRLNSGRAKSDGPLADDTFIQGAQTLASVSLGKNLVPQDFLPNAAVAALTGEGITCDQAFALIDRLVASGVIERRNPGGNALLRFSLDPAAEYLAAIRQLFKLRTAGREEWQNHLCALRQTDGYPGGLEGYLAALATCYRAYKTDFSLPDLLFPWEEKVAKVSATLTMDYAGRTASPEANADQSKVS